MTHAYYLEGQGDLVTSLRIPITHTVTLVILFMNPLSPPDPQSRNLFSELHQARKPPTPKRVAGVPQAGCPTTLAYFWLVMNKGIEFLHNILPLVYNPVLPFIYIYIYLYMCVRVYEYIYIYIYTYVCVYMPFGMYDLHHPI